MGVCPSARIAADAAMWERYKCIRQREVDAFADRLTAQQLEAGLAAYKKAGPRAALGKIGRGDGRISTAIILFGTEEEKAEMWERLRSTYMEIAAKDEARGMAGDDEEEEGEDLSLALAASTPPRPKRRDGRSYKRRIVGEVAGRVLSMAAAGKLEYEISLDVDMAKPTVRAFIVENQKAILDRMAPEALAESTKPRKSRAQWLEIINGWLDCAPGKRRVVEEAGGRFDRGGRVVWFDVWEKKKNNNTDEENG